MSIAKLCRKSAVTIREGDDLDTAARVMREKHVGYLIVVKPRVIDGSLVPVGVLTDRDIVVKVLAPQVDLRKLKVGDVMTQQPAMVTETDELNDALGIMRKIGVRRLPVISSGGQLIGVLSMDDILDVLAEELSNVAGSIRRAQDLESALVP